MAVVPSGSIAVTTMQDRNQAALTLPALILGASCGSLGLELLSDPITEMGKRLPGRSWVPV